MRKPRIALFALNGIGSMVLKTLCDTGYNIVGLWTRREPNPHPYYVSINIHQSLLPRHRGKNPFKAVIEAKDKESGVTAHHIDDEWDHGKTISQYQCSIEHLSEGEVRARLGVLTACMAVNVISALPEIKATTYNHIIQNERIEKWV